ncbi:hypothetical protein RHMOL_Rhmol10G0276000 [Rhododendron molle]|uniref:Uncharacterized protein n=1 Tax=Rhododendron molle TaxID=49168 RepID=A0ACC0M7Y4_RHOML|nr:hypothetical protein RHMOL_Rhmol10G0276000 [Rhododendron molle]
MIHNIEFQEFEPLIQKPYTIVYLHSAASLQRPASWTTRQPDLGWMRRVQQILGRKHQRNLHAIYVLHPTFGLKAAILAMQLFVDGLVWKKVVYVDRLLQLFRYVPREQLTIPDFVFQLSPLCFSFESSVLLFYNFALVDLSKILIGLHI